MQIWEQIITYLQLKIDLWWGLVLQLDILTCILLFLGYGIIFEILYSRSIYAMRDYKATQAATLNTLLYCISLWGLNESLNENIAYAIPIALGSWIGIYIQVTIEKRRETKRRASGETEREI
jgi:uncharacterized protein YebE (UPF0316 family)